MPVFFIASHAIGNHTVTITGPLLQHLRASLRTQPGEEIRVTDDRRRRYRIRVNEVDRSALRGKILSEEHGPAPSLIPVLLGQALVKGDRMDWIVQKTTELGIAALVPLISRRAVSRPRPERLASQQQRWQRIALEAAQQAERWEVPAVDPFQDVTDFFNRHAPSPDGKLILSERWAGEPLHSISLPHSGGILLAVGPEGGWAEDELQVAAGAGFKMITLGPRILRAETAALAAVSVLQSRLGEMG